MGGWKVGAVVGGVALVAVIVYLGFLVLDGAATLDDARSEQQFQRQREEILRAVALHAAPTPLTRSGLDSFLRQEFGGKYIIKVEPDRIEVDTLAFWFDGETLKGITRLGSANPAVY